MPDFSGASLKLKAEGEDKLLATLDKIDKKARDTVGGWGRLTQSEVDKSAAAFDALYGKQSKAAKQTQQVIEDVTQKVDAATRRGSTSVLAMSRGLETMARTGRETGRSLDTILANVSQMAFGFGGSGALVGAIAIGTAAIVEMFARAGREMDKLTAQYAADTEKMVRSTSLMGVDLRRVELRNGQYSIRNSAGHEGESDADFLARSQGRLGLEKEAARLKDLINKTPQLSGSFGSGGAAANANLESYRQHLEEVNRLLKLNVDEDDALGQREKTLMEIEAARAKIELDKLNSRHRLKKDPKDPYQKESMESLRFAPTVGFGQQGIPKDFLDDISLTHQIAEVVDPDKNQGKIDLFNIDESVKRALASIKTSWFAKTDAFAQQISEKIASTIGNALVAGFEAAFAKGGSIGKGFRAMTGAVLEGLGSMFEEIGTAALIGLINMQRIKDAITRFMPELGIPGAIALIALGAALKAGGSQIASANGGGGSGYGASGSGSLPGIVNTGVVTAASPNSVVTNPSSIQSRAMQQNTFYVIGPDDPRAGRQIQQLLNNNARRG